MEGDTVQSRPLFHLLRILPTPLRWSGQELVRFIHWLDHQAGRLLLGLRSSPAWCFVTLAGTVGVGMTVAFFVSVMDQSSTRHSKPVNHRALANTGRAELEQNHDWSAQDRWRVAHLFVPHKPAEPMKNIQIDSRLMTQDAEASAATDWANSRRTGVTRSVPEGKDFEVRLDTSRPRVAQQGKRLTSESSFHSVPNQPERSKSQIHRRDPRLLIQAEWDFGSTCSRDEYVTLPTRPVRRWIPEPIPEPEIPPAACPISVPDLWFEMAVTRHFTASGPFPPDSHIVRQSGRSAFPDDESRFENALVSFGAQTWQRSELTENESTEEILPYAGIGGADSMIGMRQTSDEFDPALSSTAEVALQLEWIVPSLQVDGRSRQSMLMVRNEGRNEIPRIEVQDFVPESLTLTGATPGAAIEAIIDPETGSEAKLLHRELFEFPSGNEQQFSLKWIPEHGRRTHRRTRVIAEAAVSTTTDVASPEPDQQMPSIPPEAPPEKHPSLACDIEYPEKTTVGNDLELKIRVRNTGDTALHQVKVRIELPGQLSHPDGNAVVFDAGKLLVRGQAETVLKLSAAQAGNAVNVLQASAAEHVQARGTATIVVVQRSSEPALPTPNREPIPAKPLAVPSPSRHGEPLRSKPMDRCCCQQTPVWQLEPDFRFP